MEEKDLNKVIEVLEQNSSEDDAYFEFVYGNDDYIHIKSNSDGLKVFSKEILKTIKSFKNTDEVSRNCININTSDWFFKNDIFSPYIEPVYEKRENIKEELGLIQKTWRDKLRNFIAYGFFILILLSIIVGLITILSWVF